MEHKVITIARTYGSGGRTLGRMLAEEMGIPYYDRDLIRIASDKSGINVRLFGQADEKLKSSLFPRKKKVYTGDVLPPESNDFVANDNLFNLQAEVIKEIAGKESCIIIGRCADYVLKDMPGLLRLYFYAPKKDCIDRVMAVDTGTEREISRKIDKIDKYRSDYYYYYTGQNWKDAENYDLCLNTSSTSYDKLIKFVKNYIEIM